MNTNTKIKRKNDKPSALELSPNVCEFVIKQWASRFDDYAGFEREMNWMALQIIKSHENNKQALLEDLNFVIGFGTRQMIDDYLFEPEAA